MAQNDRNLYKIGQMASNMAGQYASLASQERAISARREEVAINAVNNLANTYLQGKRFGLERERVGLLKERHAMDKELQGSRVKQAELGVETAESRQELLDIETKAAPELKKLQLETARLGAKGAAFDVQIQKGTALSAMSKGLYEQAKREELVDEDGNLRPGWRSRVGTDKEIAANLKGAQMAYRLKALFEPLGSALKPPSAYDIPDLDGSVAGIFGGVKTLSPAMRRTQIAAIAKEDPLMAAAFADQAASVATFDAASSFERQMAVQTTDWNVTHWFAGGPSYVRFPEYASQAYRFMAGRAADTGDDLAQGASQLLIDGHKEYTAPLAALKNGTMKDYIKGLNVKYEKLRGEWIDNYTLNDQLMRGVISPEGREKLKTVTNTGSDIQELRENFEDVAQASVAAYNKSFLTRTGNSKQWEPEQNPQPKAVVNPLELEASAKETVVESAGQETPTEGQSIAVSGGGVSIEYTAADQKTINDYLSARPEVRSRAESLNLEALMAQTMGDEEGNLKAKMELSRILGDAIRERKFQAVSPKPIDFSKGLPKSE